MSLRKMVVWAFVVLVLVLAVLAYFGNRLIFVAYVGLLVPFVFVHAAFVCARCTNVACAFNSKSTDFFLRLRRGSRAYPAGLGYSDIDAKRAGLPLALILLLPLVAVWQLSIIAFVAVLAYAGVAMAVYLKETCRFCTNECPMNRNQAYWEWKHGKR